MEQEPIQPVLPPMVTLGLKFHRPKKNPHDTEYNAFGSKSPVHNTLSDLPQGSPKIASALSETDVPAQSGSKGQSPPGNHVPDAERNTSYAPTVPQSSESVNPGKMKPLLRRSRPGLPPRRDHRDRRSAKHSLGRWTSR